jgi:ATP-dependent Clp protease ATP-binding subunit ClpA
VLEFSLREALQLADSDIGPEHLLLGLVDEREGVGASILVNLGADISRVRQVVLMQMADVTSEELDQEAESERRHIVEGLLRGIDEIDDVNRAVRNCPDRISALQVLTSLPFEYTEVQARHVLALRVESLVTNRGQALRDELHNLESKGGDGD